jgi:hypothetical protein
VKDTRKVYKLACRDARRLGSRGLCAEGMQHVGVRDAQTDKCAARHIIDDLSFTTS